MPCTSSAAPVSKASPSTDTRRVFETTAPRPPGTTTAQPAHSHPNLTSACPMLPCPSPDGQCALPDQRRTRGQKRRHIERAQTTPPCLRSHAPLASPPPLSVSSDGFESNVNCVRPRPVRCQIQGGGIATESMGGAPTVINATITNTTARNARVPPAARASPRLTFLAPRNRFPPAQDSVLLPLATRAKQARAMNTGGSGNYINVTIVNSTSSLVRVYPSTHSYPVLPSPTHPYPRATAGGASSSHSQTHRARRSRSRLSAFLAAALARSRCAERRCRLRGHLLQLLGLHHVFYEPPHRRERVERGARARAGSPGIDCSPRLLLPSVRCGVGGCRHHVAAPAAALRPMKWPATHPRLSSRAPRRTVEPSISTTRLCSAMWTSPTLTQPGCARAHQSIAPELMRASALLVSPLSPRDPPPDVPS